MGSRYVVNALTIGLKKLIRNNLKIDKITNA